eukprot:SAG31_NODE_30781_length_376_cov_0.743682_1_plen_56_part_01
MELELSSNALQVFDSTAALKTTAYMAGWEARAACDVVAPEFDRQAVIALLRADPRP